MPRQLFATKTEWEPFIGYSRAVRVGDHVFVSGTVATDANGAAVAPGDGYAQTIQVLENLKTALERAGALLDDVVRTRMFVTDISEVAGVRPGARRVFPRHSPGDLDDRGEGVDRPILHDRDRG